MYVCTPRCLKVSSRAASSLVVSREDVSRPNAGGMGRGLVTWGHYWYMNRRYLDIDIDSY